MTRQLVHIGGKLMALPTVRPILISGTYYLKQRVPADLVHVVGSPQVKVSLRTKDPAEARSGSRPTSSNWLGSTAATATARLRRRPSTYSPTGSSCAVCQATSAPTTALSSSRRSCGIGSQPSARRRPLSRLAVRGRNDTSSPSTLGSGMNCSTARSFTHFAKQKSSSRAGDDTTILNVLTARLATSHRLRTCSC